MGWRNPFSQANRQATSQEVANLFRKGDTLGGVIAAIPSPYDFGWSEQRAYATDNAAAPDWQKLGYSSEAEYNADRNGAPAAGQDPGGAPASPLRTPVGNSGGTTVTPNMAVFNGQRYDLNSPGDIQRYIQDKDGYFNGIFDTFRNNATQAKDLDILQANEEEKKAQHEIAQALEKLSTSENEYNRTYATNLKDLFDGFVSGSASRQNYYAQISPMVAQSAQAEGQKYAQGKYDEATADAEHKKQLAGNEFSRARTDYAQQKEDIGKQTNLFKLQRENQYNQDLASKQQELQGYKDENRTVGENAMRSVNSKFGGFTGLNPISYKAEQADFSKYTPYINFSPVQQQPSSVNGFKVQAQQQIQPGTPSLNQWQGAGVPQETNIKSIDQFLGRS